MTAFDLENRPSFPADATAETTPVAMVLAAPWPLAQPGQVSPWFWQVSKLCFLQETPDWPLMSCDAMRISNHCKRRLILVKEIPTIVTHITPILVPRHLGCPLFSVLCSLLD